MLSVNSSVRYCYLRLDINRLWPQLGLISRRSWVTAEILREENVWPKCYFSAAGTVRKRYWLQQALSEIGMDCSRICQIFQIRVDVKFENASLLTPT